MASKPTDENEPTQETPKGHEIPVPTREEVIHDLQKVAKPKKPRRRKA